MKNREIAARVSDHSHEIFRAVFFQSPVGIEIYNQEGLLIDANTACLKIFGVESVEEVRGFRLFDDPNLPADAKTRLLNGEAVKYESEFNFDIISKMSLYPTSRNGNCYIDCHIQPLLTDEDGFSGFIVHVMDITERRRAENDLKRSEGLLAESQRVASIGSWEWDIATNRLKWSDEVYTLYGLDREKVVPTYEIVLETLHPDYRESFIRDIDEALNRRKPFDREYCLVRPDGSERFTHTKGKVYCDKAGNPVRMMGVVQDITKRKRVEIALRGSEEKFRTIFSSAGIGIALSDIDRTIIDCNPALEKLLGYSREELIGKSIADISHPEDEAANIVISKTSLAERQEHFRIEKRYIRKDGEVIHGLLSVSNIFTAGGEPEFLIGVIEDITERKKYEEALMKIERRYRMFLDSTTDVSFLKDDNFRYVIVNKAFTSLMGKTKREIIGKTDFELSPPDVAEFCRQSDIRALKSDGVVTGEEVAGNRILEVRKFRVDIGNGKFGIGSLVRDITDQRRMEEAIEKSHQVLLNVLDGIDAIVYVADMETYEVLYANKYVKNHFGDITGNICWKTIQTGQTGPCPFCTNHKLLTPEGLPAAACHWEFRNTVNDRWYDIRDRAIEWRDGRTVRLEIANDITELKEAEATLRSMSFVDDLTGLYNRRGFLTLAEQQLKTAHREKKELLLIFADLDNMKWTNDSFGHLTGDKTLKDVAGILRETFRESDIIARVGGDEFVILAMEDPEAGSVSLISRLESRIGAYNSEKRLFNLALSLGITRYDPDNPSSLDELMNRADAMMYRQKNEKKKS
ncbi:MAG: PAS domain S-box protein [Nitrospirae bacterium]|nr:PAS domain S-box protein [Nitrospirota bacterium]